MMQIAVMALCIGYLIYLFKKSKIDSKDEILLAFFMSLAWVYFSGIYDYKTENHMLFGINLFPLIAWTTVLVLLKEIYEDMKGKHKLIKATGLYLVSLIVIEYLGYNYMFIQINNSWGGLFNMELLHIPFWAQVYYLTAGPLFLIITDKLRVR